MKGASVVALPRRLRCAIYTRKSSEEGLDMEFNSLDAQRDACAAYTTSQKAEGWVALRDSYDDGGFSGGTLERPALKRLLADIEAGLIDVVVVYKIDRLSRSLMDFARLVEVFDRNNVTFVSVTQSFNTTTSMGRLTLNILLSFAQFEREVIGERIRDKVAASRRRGMWMGGFVPIGYDVKDRKLVINQTEAALVRQIFERFVLLGSVTLLVRELQAERRLTKRGRSFDKGIVYKLINNRVYVGDAVHKGTAYPGEHQPIITRDLWDKVRATLQGSPRMRAGSTRAATPALLKGLLYGPTGCAMSPTHTRRGDKLYRYYISQSVVKRGADGCPVSRVPAADFTIVMARTGEGKRSEGISAFVVERGTPGFIVEREIKMLGGQRTYELVFDNLRIPAGHLLGTLGAGFAPMQLRLNVRRLQMGAWCIGMSRRALDMMVDHAKQRVTFGVKLADRQAIQWWIAEAATKIHACRLMVLDAAAKLDAGQEVRTEASMIKVFATEMAQEVIDHAMQTFGAMGVAKELPLQVMMQKVRTMRVYEGPSEVHRMAIARRILSGRG